MPIRTKKGRFKEEKTPTPLKVPMVEETRRTRLKQRCLVQNLRTLD